MMTTRLPLGLMMAAGIVLTASLCGCDYFRPSQPELPEGRSINPVYTSPENTMTTLQLAIEDKSGSNGQSAYIGGFANLATDGQAYVATFDPRTVDRFPPGQSTEWDTGREELFYANLSRLLPTSLFSFRWGAFRGAPDDDETSVPRVYYRSYELLATPDDGVTFVPVARGNAELHFIQVGSNWKIVRWVDSEDPEANFDIGELCFGQLRLAGP